MPQSPYQVNIGLLNGAAIGIPAAPDRSLLVSESLPALYNATLLGNSFFAANPTGVTTSAGLATTYVGLCLSNPAVSTVNLILTRISAALIVDPATITNISLITGFAAGGITAHTTPLSTYSAIIGGAAVSQGLVDSACTLVGTPVWSDVLAQGTSAILAANFNQSVPGDLIIPPGGYVAIGTNIAGPASGFKGAFRWIERPLAG